MQKFAAQVEENLFLHHIPKFHANRMYALRERRVHVTQEDFEMAVAKIMQKDSEKNMSIKKLFK